MNFTTWTLILQINCVDFPADCTAILDNINPKLRTVSALDSGSKYNRTTQDLDFGKWPVDPEDFEPTLVPFKFTEKNVDIIKK